MLPDVREIETPLLEVLFEMGGEGRPHEICLLVREKFPEVPDDVFAENLKSGRNRWTHRVYLARRSLYKTGDVESPARGIWRITDTGQKRLNSIIQSSASTHMKTTLNIDDLVQGDAVRAVALSRKRAYLLQTVISPESVEDYKRLGYVILGEVKSGVKVAKPKSDNKKLEDEIWLLMWRLGFSTFNRTRDFWINRGNPSAAPELMQVDVFAKDDDGHVFIIKCKHSETQLSQSVRALIDDFDRYRSQLTYSVRQAFSDLGSKKLKITFIVVTRNLAWNKRDLEYAQEKQVFVWRDQDIEHVNGLAKLYNLIGDAVRYQLYGRLFAGQRIANLDGQQVAAIEGKAGDNTFYQFVATPMQLLRIAYVHHRKHSPNMADLEGISRTYQRVLKSSKIKAIGQFIDRRNYFPNSIIISFTEPPRFDSMGGQKNLLFKAGRLTLPNTYGSAWIIDGQHRLYGFARSQRGMNDPIPVVAFKNLSVSEQSKLFVEINKNQTNVGTNLLWDLYGDIYEGTEDAGQQIDLTISNIVKLLDTMEYSPFAGHIYIPSHGKASSKRNLTMASICQSIKRNGILDRDKLGRRELEQEKFEDFAARRIAAFFQAIVSLYPEDWARGDSGYLRTNNGVASFLILLRRTLNYMINEEKNNLYTKSNTSEFEGEVRKLFLPVINHLKAEPSRSSEFRKRAGGAGQKASADELSKVIRNKYKSFRAPDDESGTEASVTTQDREQQPLEDLDDLIKKTELLLRELIRQVLQNLHATAWYRRGFPGQVKKFVEGHLNQEIRNFPYKASELQSNLDNRLEYTSLGHLKDIIIYSNNWSGFEPVFKAQQNVEMHLKSFNDLRNAHRGHMRKVDPVLMKSGRASIDWITQCVLHYLKTHPNIMPNATPYEY